MSGPVAGSRRLAREAAFKAAYQADVAGDRFAAAHEMRQSEEPLAGDALELVQDLVGVLEQRLPDVDAAIQAAAQRWPLARMAATDRAVLRVAVAELMARAGSPARVVLDEAIEIARRYGSDESGGFVNGVLDRVARTLRPAEFA